MFIVISCHSTEKWTALLMLINTEQNTKVIPNGEKEGSLYKPTMTNLMNPD
jgi:hypothetical protein